MKRAVLLGVSHSKGYEIEKSLEELSLLAKSVGIEGVGTFWQFLSSPLPTYLGSGKLNSVSKYIELYRADGVITDDELTIVQRSKLEEILKVEVLDRTEIILRAFSRSATTEEGKIEVELATLEYTLSHLRSKGFSRTGGGIGTVGPGETKLEMDRRVIKKKIGFLREELERIEKNKSIKKSRRNSSLIPKVSIAGYTNAGKSMLLKSLSGFDIKSEDKLFTTLDPITRRVWIGENLYALFSDTVGFISKLPAQLVKAFKATLDEIKEANLILIVADGADDDIEKKINVSLETIDEIGASNIPILKVINKIDLCSSSRLSMLSRKYNDAIFVSATKGLYLDDLVSRVREELTRDYIPFEGSIDVDKWQKILNTDGVRVLRFESMDGVVHVKLKINSNLLSKVREIQNVFQA
ncbi:GTPase HflX [Athalassotoga saccharophila]|uniref:GTPase HflX n=1 Tax=Athalassotoga saccharophila TaxID=1441386 RepID=UPI00137B645E|nr:GTPase HflX [Athalassotoga saccharophila]BBJ27919.1 GTPase HflX [Athalassotoga saccharophila]